jgi:hypothetical protein
MPPPTTKPPRRKKRPRRLDEGSMSTRNALGLRIDSAQRVLMLQYDLRCQPAIDLLV